MHLSLYLAACESQIGNHILERFFIDLVAGESRIKEQAAAITFFPFRLGLFVPVVIRDKGIL